MTDKMLEYLEEKIQLIKEPKIKKIYENCFKCTWETTWNRLDDGKTYVITGDIEAMWLRDSSMQVLPYFSLLEDEEVRQGMKGLIEKQAEFILIDPYANAFNKNGDYACYSHDHTKMGPQIWERKYEIDSLAFPCFLIEKYYELTKDASIFTETVKKAIKLIIHIWNIEKYHLEKSDYLFERDSDLFTETLQNSGRGSNVGYTGMTWSGFRPSDDACTYHYLIPSNMLAVSVLKKMDNLPIEKELTLEAKKLAEEIEKGIYEYGVIEHPEYGKIFAYETDGLGNYNLMDDANIPSLLSIPWFGFCDKEDEIYKNTRKFVLSKENPYYYEGKEAKGIGSPHTPVNYVWHIALAVQGLTASTQKEKYQMIELLSNTTAQTWHMHESFHPDEPEKFTRSWFAWADSMFCLLVNDYLEGEK